MRPAHRRALRDGLIVAGLVYLAWRFLVLAPLDGHVGADAWAYWLVDPTAPYALPNGLYGAFLYPPPMVRALRAMFSPAGPEPPLRPGIAAPASSTHVDSETQLPL